MMEIRYMTRKKVIRYLDTVSILCAILCFGLYMQVRHLSRYSLGLLFIPFLISGISVLLNLRAPASDKVVAYRFGFMSYWHPYCTFIDIISIIILELPGQLVIVNILKGLSTIIIISTALWSFIKYIRN